ncbi:MAG: single-stranded DNA-binding protein [Bacteroidales bacterium]|nr:single-stranded DNA-binding protein [Candidatus Cryptobacteroides aphodequi]
MSVNKVILVGNVGKDPEVRYLESQTKVARFTLATSERYSDRNGEQRENTEWHNIVAWRKNADICEKFVHKGTQLFIEGKIRTRSYTDANGVKKFSTEIEVDNLQLLGRRENGAEGGYQGDAEQGGWTSQSAPQPARPAQYARPATQQAPAYQQAPVQQAPVQQSAPANSGAAGFNDMPDDDLPF